MDRPHFLKLFFAAVLVVLFSLELTAVSPQMAQGQQATCDLDFFNDGTKWCVFYFPHYAVGGGTEYLNGFRVKDGWETGVIVKNALKASTAEVVVDWRDNTGRGFALKFQPGGIDEIIDANNVSYRLQPLGASQSVLSLPSNEIKVGWMRVLITADRANPNKPSGEVFLQFRFKKEGQILGQATVEPMIPRRSMSFYAKRYTASNRDKVETGVALANPNDTPAAITITRRHWEGTVLDSFNEVIPARSHLSKFLSELRTLNMEFEGSIEIESNVPIVGVALQTTGDSQNFNFSTIPLSTLTAP